MSPDRFQNHETMGDFSQGNHGRTAAQITDLDSFKKGCAGSGQRPAGKRVVGKTGKGREKGSGVFYFRFGRPRECMVASSPSCLALLIIHSSLSKGRPRGVLSEVAVIFPVHLRPSAYHLGDGADCSRFWIRPCARKTRRGPASLQNARSCLPCET